MARSGGGLDQLKKINRKIPPSRRAESDLLGWETGGVSRCLFAPLGAFAGVAVVVGDPLGDRGYFFFRLGAGAHAIFCCMYFCIWFLLIFYQGISRHIVR